MTVLITAQANEGYKFTGWSNSTTINKASQSIIMDMDRSIIAEFTIIQHTLTIEESLHGRVYLSKEQSLYDYETIISLYAVPDDGYEFVGWGGDISGSNQEQSLIMNTDKYISATFDIIEDILDQSVTVQLSNFPNPFSDFTTIEYSINNNSKVMLTVYNAMGDVIEVLVDDYKIAGSYNVKLDASNLIEGIYFYQLRGDFNTITKKILLVK